MDDEEDDYVPRIALGDVSAIAVAGCFSLLCLGLIVYMIFGGHPLAGLIGQVTSANTAAQQQPSQADVPMHLAPGEVRVFIPSKTKKQPPKP
jgi:p-aminobenzoyl-glutamate transporter AbgT